MKRLLLIILPLLLIVGCSKSVEDLTLINKDGLMYSPGSDKPYTGEVFTNYDTGEKEYQGTYENGLLVSYSYLNKDGSVKEPVNGETLIERSGLMYEVNGQKPYTGDFFVLYDNGNRRSSGRLKGGKKDGLSTSWYKNGKKQSEKTFKDGKIINYKHFKWFRSGQKQDEGTYKDGEKDGLYTGWYENGQKRVESTYKDGMLYVVAEWFRSGKKKEDNELFKEDESGTTKMVLKSGDYVPQYDSSSILWECTWLAGKAHNGDISIKEGSVKIEDGALVYANFIVDMNSMKCFDIKNLNTNKKLIGHLKSDDFFDVQNHPESSLNITSSENISHNRFRFIGQLTIKNITSNVTMDGSVKHLSDGYKIDIQLLFDRSKYDVRYRSASFFNDLGDRIISDNVSLNVKLKIRKKTFKS